jgi:hypothetical protein
MAGSRGSPEARRSALANNRARLAQLYAEYRRYTVNYIARRVKPQHSHVVDDLAQDTFVAAWPSLHTVEVRDGSSYRRWCTSALSKPTRPGAMTPQRCGTPATDDSRELSAEVLRAPGGRRMARLPECV